jgi:hypothetical protein
MMRQEEEEEGEGEEAMIEDVESNASRELIGRRSARSELRDIDRLKRVEYQDDRRVDIGSVGCVRKKKPRLSRQSKDRQRAVFMLRVWRDGQAKREPSQRVGLTGSSKGRTHQQKVSNVGGIRNVSK